MIEIKSPFPFKEHLAGKYTIFLGGSIEMNRAERWQDRVVKEFKKKKKYHKLVLLNPRRDDWDSSWSQDPTPGTPFNEQVIWEMDAQDNSDLIVYYFDPDTIAPITLLELGAYGGRTDFFAPRVVVCCPDGYFRKGNVVLFCQKFNIRLTESVEDLISAIEDYIS